MPTPDKSIRIRRTDDLCPPGGQPFDPGYCTTAHDMRTRIAALERENTLIKSAFVLNDLKLPDYEGHRRDHILRMKAAEIMDKYKMDAVSKILGTVAVFVLGLVASGFIAQLPRYFK